RESGLVGYAMHLQIRGAICEPVNVFGHSGRERSSASVGLLFRRFELRQSKLPPYMVTTSNRIVAREGMHQEPLRRCRVTLDRKRTILGAMSRPWHQCLAVSYVTTKDFGDLVN